jgi:hypothetical protein
VIIWTNKCPLQWWPLKRRKKRKRGGEVHKRSRRKLDYLVCVFGGTLERKSNKKEAGEKYIHTYTVYVLAK